MDNKNNISDLPIVTFGKYKDKSVLELIADEEYVKWLKLQSWFPKQKSIYNIIVNQQVISQNNNCKTPEHNKLQNMFLNNKYVEKLWYLIFNKYCIIHNHKQLKLNNYKTEFEGDFNWDIIFTFNNDIQCLNNDRNCCTHEFCRFDVFIFCEIKPLLSDDYPNVLRKIKMQKKITEKCKKYIPHYSFYYLIIDKFVSDNTTEEELLNIFRQSNIKIIFIGDILNNRNEKENILSEIDKLQNELNELNNITIQKEKLLLSLYEKICK